MSDTPSAAQPQPVTINLRDMGMKYLGAIQRVYDLASCTIGALRVHTEKDYEDFARSLRFMPSQSDHLEFEKVRGSAENWLLKHHLNEALGILVPFLEDTRSIASLARWKATNPEDSTMLKKIVQDDRKTFLALGLQAKLDFLQSEFGIAAMQTGVLPAVVRLGQCLFARNGVVAKEDAGENGEMSVPVFSVNLQTVPGKTAGQVEVAGRMMASERRFKVGETVDLKKEEALSLIGALGMVITGMLNSLQAYAQKTLPNEGQS